MGVRHNHWFAIAVRLALAALALAACTPAATLEPTSVPTETPLPTAPPTPAATATEPAPTAVPNIPVPATSVQLQDPNDLALDADGNLYFSECGNSGVAQVEKVDPTGRMTMVAGQESGLTGDGGPAVNAEMQCAEGLAFDHDGNLYVADSYNNRIRKIDRLGVITTVAGSGPEVVDETKGAFAGDGGPATAAVLFLPTDVAFDPQGNLYISDGSNFRIRKVDKQGIITTVVGNGTRGFAGDGGSATAAEIDLNIVSTGGQGTGPGQITFDADGNLYFADSGNRRVRMVDQNGIIHTIAGDGGPAVGGDGGPARAATLSRPTGLAFDAAGNLYVACTHSETVSDNRIRKIDRQGVITTVVGTGQPYLSGDNGAATAATVWYPRGLEFDAQGNLFLIDAGNQRVRKVDTNGVITTVAGGAP